MEFKNFTSIYEVFIGYLSITYVFDLAHDSFKNWYIEKYNLVKKSQSVYFKDLKNEISISYSSKRRKKLKSIKRDYKKEIQKGKFTFRKEKAERKHAKNLIHCISIFILLYYIMILFLSGIENNEFVDTHMFVWNFHIFFIFIYIGYCLNAVSNFEFINNSFLGLKKINYRWVFKWFVLMTLISFLITKYQLGIEISFNGNYFEYILFIINFSLVFIPLTSIIYRNKFYMLYKFLQIMNLLLIYSNKLDKMDEQTMKNLIKRD